MQKDLLVQELVVVVQQDRCVIDGRETKGRHTSDTNVATVSGCGEDLNVQFDVTRPVISNTNMMFVDTYTESHAPLKATHQGLESSVGVITLVGVFC